MRLNPSLPTTGFHATCTKSWCVKVNVQCSLRVKYSPRPAPTEAAGPVLPERAEPWVQGSRGTRLPALIRIQRSKRGKTDESLNTFCLRHAYVSFLHLPSQPPAPPHVCFYNIACHMRGCFSKVCLFTYACLQSTLRSENTATLHNS